MNWLRSRLRTFAPDALAFEFSGAPTTVIRHFFIEPHVLDYTWWQGGVWVAVYFFLRLGTSRLTGKLKDNIEARWFGPSANLWQRWLAGSIALTTYQLPLYTLFALVTGVSFRQLAAMWGFLAILNLATGEWYEYCLRHARVWLLAKPALKPALLRSEPS